MEKLFKKKPKTVSYENSNNTNNNNNNNSSKLANMNGPTIHKPAFDSKNGSDKKAHISAPVPPPTVPPKGGATEQTTVSKPQLIFHCQLAQGSQTGFITGFSSVKELYQKIAEYYEFPIEEVLKLFWISKPRKPITCRDDSKFDPNRTYLKIYSILSTLGLHRSILSLLSHLSCYF